MASLFSLIEGKVKSILFGNDGTADRKIKTKTDGTLLIDERQQGPLGYALFDNTITGAQTNFLIDFNGVRKDIHLENDSPITVRLNSISSDPMVLSAGIWDWTDEYANKIYITTTVSTMIQLYANG
jgi:hypothetical protein